MAWYIDYIHYSPIKHGHVSCAADWPHSSFHRFAQRGVYALDWGTADEINHAEFWE